MRKASIPTEADILAEIVAPDRQGLPREAAECILALKFNPKATKDIRRLLQKNNRGAITTGERITLEKYLRMGQFLDLLQAKARLSLQRSATAS